MVGSPTLFKDWFLQLWPKFTKSTKNYSYSVGSSHIEVFVKKIPENIYRRVFKSCFYFSVKLLIKGLQIFENEYLLESFSRDLFKFFNICRDW